jgi:protoheme IX farnesyltransferase
MKDKLSRFAELTKPKVTLLNLLVGATCFILAAYPNVNLLSLAVFILAGYLACGGCGALNCVYDQDTDKLMQRTSKRAIPSGSISQGNALLFGVVLTGLGIGISGFFFNPLTALMMTLGTIFYLVVYTIVLKRASSLNVVIGGLAGCFAALSGWTAAANTLSMLPLLVSTVDFLWTPGHLWGLAMKKVKEYRAAGIPMLPVTAGLKRAARTTFVFNFAAVAFSLSLPALGLAGVLYALVASCAAVWFTFESERLLSSPTDVLGFRVFLVSMPYLGLLMVGLIADKLVYLKIG